VIAVSTYIRRYRYDSNRCKAEVYLWAWAILFLGATAIVFPTESLTAVKWFGSSIIVTPIKFLWTAACWLVVNGWGLICSCVVGLWSYVIVPLALGAWKIFTFCYHPFGIPLPWWLILAAAFGASAGLSLLADKLIHYNKTEGKRSYRSSWRYLIQSFFRHEGMSHLRTRFREYLYENDDSNLFYTLDTSALKYLTEDVMHIYFDDVFKTNLDKLDSKPVPVTSWMTPWKSAKFSELEELTGIHDWRDIICERNKTAFWAWIPKFMKTERYLQLKENALASHRAREAALKEAQIRRDNAPSRVMCKAITSTLDSSISTAANKVSSKITSAYRQVKIGLSYAKELLKAKKQGACPYMRFTENSLQEAPPVNKNGT
jgi:hypothetical protein